MIFGGIDPGAKKSALAMGTETALTSLGFCSPCNLGYIDHALVEFPRIYPGVASKVDDNGRRHSIDPNDVLEVAAIAGAWISHNPAAERVYPRDWKGQVKKPVHHLQLWRKASEQDRRVIAAADGREPKDVEQYIRAAASAIALGTKVTYTRQVHNLLDAYGLYKGAVKRWTK